MDAPIVWMDAAPEQVPSVLQTWASARGLRLVSPSEGGLHAIAVDPSVAAHVEEQLHSARELVTQHDADGAERALARAEAMLRAHPELPQAAWLLAEVERGWASRFFQLEPRDMERAARHWKQAAALDGGRAPGVSEAGIHLGVPKESNVQFFIDTSGNAQPISFDGDPIVGAAHEAPAGMHQLVAQDEGHVVFAQWITIAHGTVVHVALPTAEPCSRADLASASPHCASWVSAKRGDRAGTFVVRSCSGAACGSDLLVAPMTYTPEKQGGSRSGTKHGLPTWAIVTLTGAGILVAGAVASVVGYYAIPPTEQVVFKTSKPQ